MKRILMISAIFSLALVSACETIQAEDRSLLGEATRANISEQSVRDVNLPNSKAVEAASGVRAVAAVKALNEGQTKQLASSGGTGGRGVMSALPQRADTPVPEPAVGSVPALAALAAPARFDSLKPACAELHDLSQMPAPDAVLRHGGGLILIEQGMAGWDQLLLLLAVERPATAVVVLSDQLPAHMVRALSKLSVWDVLPASASVGEIVEAALRLAEHHATEAEKDEPGNSVCWAFRGAVGGAGVSTLAIESAFALARVVGPGRVCLVDLNLADGMTASFLEAVPKLDLAALSNAPERLDARLLAAWCWQHQDGVSIIAAPRNPEADALAHEAAVLRLLDVACAAFPFVILDMPRHMMAWTKPVLSAVDQVIVVSELTVPSLHAAADMCRDIDVLRGEANKAHLVLNRMFKKQQLRAGFPVEKAEQAIERKIDITITSDWDAARTAANLGRPIADVKPKSPLVTDVDRMVRQFAPEGLMVAAAPQKKEKKGRR